MKNYFEILQISESAEGEIVKAAYRKLSAKYHSDNLETGDEERFKEIAEAYSILSDTEKRKDYLKKLTEFRSSTDSTEKAADVINQKVFRAGEVIDKLALYYNDLVDLRKMYFSCKEKIEKNQNHISAKIRKNTFYYIVCSLSFLFLFLILFVIQRAIGLDSYIAQNYNEKLTIMIPATASVFIVYAYIPLRNYKNRHKKPKLCRAEKKLLEQLGIELQPKAIKFADLHRELLNYVSPKYMNTCAIKHMHDRYQNNTWSTMEELLYSWDLISSDETQASSYMKVISMDEEVKQYVLSIISKR